MVDKMADQEVWFQVMLASLSVCVTVISMFPVNEQRRMEVCRNALRSLLSSLDLDVHPSKETLSVLKERFVRNSRCRGGEECPEQGPLAQKAVLEFLDYLIENAPY